MLNLKLSNYRERLSDLDKCWVEFYDEIEPYIFGPKQDEDVRFDFFAARDYAKQGRTTEAESWKKSVEDQIKGLK